MRALGRVLGERKRLSKVVFQHTTARARVGYCLVMASHPRAPAPLKLVNLQGTSLSEPALAELCHALRERGVGGPSEFNFEGCIR